MDDNFYSLFIILIYVTFLRDFLRLADPLCYKPIIINNLNNIDLSQTARFRMSSDLTKVEVVQIAVLIIYKVSERTMGTSNQSNRVCVPIINDATGETDYSEMRFVQITSFIEMNMSHEGFVCLFWLFIVPQNASSGMSSVAPIENRPMVKHPRCNKNFILIELKSYSLFEFCDF